MIANRPKYFKFKRPFNKKLKKNTETLSELSSKIAHGSFAIKIFETCKLQYHHVETMRRVLARVCKFNSKIWFRVSFDTPITGKPLEARMGKGKGKLKYYVCSLRRGTCILEIDNLTCWKAISALFGCLKKLPIKSSIRLRY